MEEYSTNSPCAPLDGVGYKTFSPLTSADSAVPKVMGSNPVTITELEMLMYRSKVDVIRVQM